MDLYEIKELIGRGKTIFDLPLRCTYYARVSTDKDEQAHSLKAQISYFESYIREQKKWTFVDGYIDEGLSGTSVSKRINFLKMIEDAKNHKFDLIITKEITRFSRSTLDSIKYTQELLTYGVGVYFQSDNINTLQADAELRLTIMTSIAQDEVRKISERVKFGFKRSIENGVVLGNSRMWGYRKDNGKLVIVEEEAKLVREIFDLYAIKNLGVRLICEELTKQGYKNNNDAPFSFTTVRNILSNPKYKGYYCGGKTSKIDYRRNDRKQIDRDKWVEYKDEENIPPIVSEELWNKANSILQSRSEKMSAEDKTSYQNKHSYSGKIICMQHNTRYYHAIYRYKSVNKEVWQCKEYYTKGKGGCDSPILYTKDLDEIMQVAVQAIIEDKENIINDLMDMYSQYNDNNAQEQKINELSKSQKKLEKRISNLLNLRLDETISKSEYISKKTEIQVELDKINTELEELKKVKYSNADIKDELVKLKTFIDVELHFENGITAEIINKLLDHIEVYKSDELNTAKIKVFFKVLGDENSQDWSIKRKHGGATSVCSRQYI